MAVESKKKGLQKSKGKMKKGQKGTRKRKAKPRATPKPDDFSNISDEEETLAEDTHEGEDEGNYDGFMEGMASLEGSKRFLHPAQVDKEDDDDFNYGVTTKTSVESLISGVPDKLMKKSIRKSFSNQVDKHKNLKLASSISTPEQEKVDRKATYQRAQKELAQWDAVVHSRRSAPSHEFPLVKPDLKLITSTNHYKSKFEAKTPLEAEVMALLSDSTAVVKPNEELSQREKTLLDKMTMREALEKRKELMKLKSLQSYQEQKIRRQNKIKSKKYRKILRKEKKKDKLKELELLHATNPELAAEKLEEMEKIRIEERATLKHRNASKFLQFQAIRSKTNAESREVVQEQLRKHRELTTKLDKATIDSDEEEIVDDLEEMSMKLSNAEPSNNPWIQTNDSSDKSKEANKDGETFDEFSASYKKFWTEVNKDKSEGSSTDQGKDEDMNSSNEGETKLESAEPEKNEESKEVEIGTEESSPKTKQGRQKKRKRESVTDTTENYPPKKKNQNQAQGKKSANEINQKKIEDNAKSIQERERLEMAETIDDLFCEAQSLVKEKMNKKLKKLKADIKGEDNTEEEMGEHEKEVHEDLAHAESLHFETDHDHKVKVTQSKKPKNIDPSNFLKVKKSVKQTEISDSQELEMSDEDEQEGIRQVIAEAFADDDVIENDFKAEKNAILEASKPKVISKVLPGWGSWGGEDIKVSKKKIKRFTFKAPPAPIRKDANKGHLILNEDKNDAIRQHQVNSVPFPFRTVKDYEASIRTPIGETFVPRTVFKKLTKPKTKTSAGVIIEPMDKEELVRRGLLKDDVKIAA